MDLKTLFREDILQLVPYSSARDEFSGQARRGAGEAPILLDANENAFDPNGRAGLNRYPDPHQKVLKEEIARWKEISPEQIFLGNGSDEAIDLLIRASCRPFEDEIMIFPPTYGMYAVQARIQGVGIREVLLTPDFQLDPEAALAALTPRTRLLFVCSPNNPTGNLIDREAIATLLRRFSGLVVVDEAYLDFAEAPGWLGELERYPNLVIMQTFSKARGLAGIRLGMAFAHPEIIGVLNKIKFPYNVNVLTQKAALKSLRQPETYRQTVREILRQRRFLEQALPAIPAVQRVYPSRANFLLVQFRQARKVFQYLRHQGIIVRDRSRLPGCQGCLRITVGTPEENQRLIQILQTMELEP